MIRSLAISSLLLLTSFAVAQEELDLVDDLGSTLKASGLNHSDIGGFFSLTFTHGASKVEQVSYVRKEKWSYNSLAVHEVFSIIYDSPDQPSDELITTMFQKRFTGGGIILEEPSKTQTNWRFRFKMDMPANASATKMKEVIQITDATAFDLKGQIDKMKSNFDEVIENALTQPFDPFYEASIQEEPLKATMDATGLSYTPTSSGLSYQLTFENKSGRKAPILVAVKPSALGTSTNHIIYGSSWIGNEAPSFNKVRAALVQTKKLGAYYLYKDANNTWTLRFGAYFDATEQAGGAQNGEAAVARLKDTIYFVNQVVDETAELIK
jgi:hypothetical protein